MAYAAWRVDFNLTLSSFEPLIAGLSHLIDLSLASPRPSPPPILFTSSISVSHRMFCLLSLLQRRKPRLIIRNTIFNIDSPSSPIHELPITDPNVAVATGYSESKWVAENILLQVAKEAGLKINIVRVGQLCGDSRIGVWNEKEWVPVILRGSQVLGAIPHRVEVSSLAYNFLCTVVPYT